MKPTLLRDAGCRRDAHRPESRETAVVRKHLEGVRVYRFRGAAGRRRVLDVALEFGKRDLAIFLLTT